MKAVGGLIGVVHLPAMPGDPHHAGGEFDEVVAHALRDADALVAGGVDGVIVENFGSSPFWKGDAGSRLPPHQVALMTRVVRAIVERDAVAVGVNCLRNDAHSALGIAAATGASFIRVNVHTGTYVTDQGLIDGEAAETLRYRQSIGATSVRVLADVLVKHATPLAPMTMSTAVKEALGRGGADAIIVTRTGTGEPVDEESLSEAIHAAGEGGLFIGSGLEPERAQRLAPQLTGAIVGTWLKEEGELSRPVDRERVARFRSEVVGRWGRPALA